MALALNKLAQSALEPATQATEPTTPAPVEGAVAEPTTPAPDPAEGLAKHIPGQTSPKSAEKPTKKTPTTESTDASLIDELFRQATDLFE